jgi:WD40 repeat protein
MVDYSYQTAEFEEESPDLMVSGNGNGANPFPGLRPFTINECHLFFGRDSQVDEILLKLSEHRAITVMGYSGSGKSSLMYCGLVPVLYGGFMTQTGPYWQVVTIRPGNSPINNLADSCIHLLLQQGRIEEKDIPIHKAILSSVLRSGPEGLVEVARFIQTRPGENVFFLVDQFEELFRFKESEDEEFAGEAAQYVNLILTAIRQKELPVYIALNMRSDFIGDCAAFTGLTQMINESNYLVPQMTRDQKRMAVEGPVAVGGGRISQRLVKRLLSDIGDHQDQLPILQHVLMRTWDYWVSNHEPGEPLDIRHYNAVGKISQALSLHANEAYDELSSREKEIAEILFKNITEKNQDNQGMRKPGRISLIAELAEAPENEVIKVVEQFRQAGRSFLMPGIHQTLKSESIIELSHESLMRIWNRLSSWVDEEFESAQMYKRISDASAMYQIGKTGLWRPPDLQLALNWQKKQRPTRTWAQRYDVAFERSIVFLDTSRITYEAELKNQEMLQRRVLRRARVTNVILAIFLLIAVAFFFFGLTQQIEAEQQRTVAVSEAKRANEARVEAEKQRHLAEEQTRTVRSQQLEIQRKNDLLEKNNNKLQEAYEDAERNLKEAIRQEYIAKESQTKEKSERERAELQTQLAQANFDKANRLLMLSIAQSLEAKSVGIDDENLAGLTAMQGYLFHTKYEGKKYDPYVFNGLYTALTKVSNSKASYNAIKTPGNIRNRMYALAISNDGHDFYTTGNDGRIFKGDYITQQISPNPVSANSFPNRVLALSRDEKYLVNGSDSSFLQILNLSEEKAKVIRVDGHTGSIRDIQFLPDNSGFISASSDKTLRITDPATGTSRKLMDIPFDLKSIDINADGSLLAGAAVMGQVVIVDLKKNTFSVLLSESPNRILSVAFHPTKALLAFGTEVLNDKGIPVKGSVKIVDLSTGKMVKELSGHKAGVSALQFSANGLLLASAGLDRKLQMWVVDHEEDLPVVMDNNNGNIWDIGFTQDCNYLIASCNVGEIRVWPTDPKMLADQVCPLLKRNMTPDQWTKYVGNDVPYETTCIGLLISDF